MNRVDLGGRWDFGFQFPDKRVILAGIGSLMDLRQAVKRLKRQFPEYARTITLRTLNITPHTFCPECVLCERCKLPKHSCEGH